MKRADLVVALRGKKPTVVVNRRFPSLAVEVGFSEVYADLMADMELWLRGSRGGVRVVTVVCLNESPKVGLQMFVMDNNFYAERAWHHGQSVGEGGPEGNLPQDRIPTSDKYGPVYRNGRMVAGKTSGFLEIWWTNAEIGKVYRTVEKV